MTSTLHSLGDRISDEDLEVAKVRRFLYKLFNSNPALLIALSFFVQFIGFFVISSRVTVLSLCL